MNSSAHTRVLVTGGAGFIGSQLIAELNRRGVSDIVVADLLGSDEKWRNLVPLSFTDYVDAGDLTAALRAGTLGSFDLVLHMGACSSTTETDAAYLIRNNYQFTRDLAELSLSSGARFVYASSAATYGDGSAGMDDTANVSYLETLRPLNMYGYSKHLFDLHAARTGLLDQCAGVKFFNVFGPNEQHKGDMRSLVNKAFTQVRETGDIRLFRSYRDDIADGEQRRDFIYINDAVAMTLFLADHKAANGLFNAGSGRAETWVELANAVFAAMGKKPSIQFIDMPEAIRAKYQYFTQANIGRLRAAGYEQEVTPLTDAVSDYVTNYLTP